MDVWVPILVSMAMATLMVVAYLPKRRKAAAPARARRSESDIDPTDESRYVHIDQEELEEGSWDFFLPALQHVLRAERVTFDAVVTDREDVREVHLGGDLLWRVDPTEVSDVAATEGLVRLSRAVNRRLEAARSPKRFYFMDAWNDLGGTLLRPDEYESLIAGEWAGSLWDADDGLTVGDPIDVRHLLLAVVPPRAGQFFYVRIPGDIGPIDRSRLYEDPLDEALEAEGLGGVSGGGTQLGADGAIVFCGIDVNVTDRDRGLACILRVMRELGAPEGTVVQEDGPEGLEHPVWVH